MKRHDAARIEAGSRKDLEREKRRVLGCDYGIESNDVD